MQDICREQRLIGWPRARLLAGAMLVTGVLVAGCGGSGAGTTASESGNTSASTGASGSGSGGRGGGSGATAQRAGHAGTVLAYARCMRANGVSNFPDPQPGGGIALPAGTNPDTPAFRQAQAKCSKFLAGGFPAAPGSTTHPSAKTLGKLVRISQCMRQHGVPQFPDPRTSVPSSPTGIQEITDFDGAILLFPTTMDLQAPAYKQALTACGAPPLGLRH